MDDLSYMVTRMFEMTKSAKIYVLLFLLIVFISVSIGSYFYNFACNPVDGFGWCPESTKEEWGQFGDFVGGILNPSLSLIVIFIAVRTYEMQRKMSEKQEGLFSTQRFLEVCTPVIKSLEILLESTPASKSEDFMDQNYKEFTLRQMLALIDHKFKHLSGLHTDFSEVRVLSAIKMLGNDNFWDDFYVPVKVMEANPKFIEQCSVMIKLSVRCGVDDSQLSDFILSLLRDEESMRGLYIFAKWMVLAHEHGKNPPNDKKYENHKIVLKAVGQSLHSLDSNTITSLPEFNNFIYECTKSVFENR